MRYFILSICFLFTLSCIPLAIAPDLKDGKVMKGKRFKRQLPNQYTYIFEDPKDANEFYKYVNAKFQVEYDDIEGNVPVNIGSEKYFLTFYEAEKQTKTINLIPMVIDAGLEKNGISPVLEEAHEYRKGTWYIVLTARDSELVDALNPEYENHKSLVKFLKEMRHEYLTTQEYIEVYLRAK